MLLKSPSLFAISVLVSWISWADIARASQDNFGLNFELPPASQASSRRTSSASSPYALENKPITSLSSSKMPKPKISKPVALALIRYEDPLPPLIAPTQKAHRENMGVSFAENILELPVKPRSSITPPVEPKSPTQEKNPQARVFPISTSLKERNKTATTHPTQAITDNISGLDDWIFDGGPSSLVAHTVGSAEGTRQLDGRRTHAYYGHIDPGNGVWNLGTFSYQHAADTPEEADEKQLQRLKQQGRQLEQQAARLGLTLSLEEKLNGIDLANQAPLAALGKGGYIERLHQAYRLKMKGSEAIAWARTRSYIDPDTKGWNAPGLGNNLYSISQDQERRMTAISKALGAFDRNGIASLAQANFESITVENLRQAPELVPRWDAYLDASHLTHEFNVTVNDTTAQPVAIPDTTDENASLALRFATTEADILPTSPASAAASHPESLISTAPSTALELVTTSPETNPSEIAVQHLKHPKNITSAALAQPSHITSDTSSADNRASSLANIDSPSVPLTSANELAEESTPLAPDSSGRKKHLASHGAWWQVRVEDKVADKK